LIHFFCSVLILFFRPFMSLTVHNRLFKTQHKHPCPRWEFFFFFFFACPGFSPLIHFCTV
jgi:quinol-cytochrome oxidoreductase complex cytochrome b subunit